jgi:molybdate transport system substrate-binding protein
MHCASLAEAASIQTLHAGAGRRRSAPRALVALVLAGVVGLASAAELTVSAAASLTNAFKEIGSAFEAAHSGIRVQFNFAASGSLLQQIAQGAPVDVFASADTETMDQAERRQLVRRGSRANFAANTLVVVVPRDATTAPRSLADLVTPAFRHVAIGVPASVPVGRYTQAVLEKAQLWAPIEAKMIGAQSVRQALDYVARGEVEAGFVYGTDAALMPDRVKVAFTVPTETPVLYPIAVVAASAHAAEAQRFAAFVLAAPAQATLRRYGFAKPSSP